MSTELKIQPSGPSRVTRPLLTPEPGIAPSALADLIRRAGDAAPSLPGPMAADVAALSGRPPSDNPLNLVRVSDSAEIPVPPSFRDAKVRLEVAGYSNAKLSAASGYEYDDMMLGLSAKGGEGKVGLLVSPTADPGSIDAAITGAAFKGNLPLLSITAESYAKYINPDKLDRGISKERYLAQPKYVLPDAESYVKANAELSNAWLAVGGGDVAGKAFRHHVELDHPIVLVDDGRGPCLSVEGLRSENASAWLADKVGRHGRASPLYSVLLNGTEHPYELDKTVALAKEAAASAKKNGSRVGDELAKRSSLPPEVFADAMMFDKAGLSEGWFRQNFDPKYDVRLSVLSLGAGLTSARSGAIAIDLLEAHLRRR